MATTELSTILETSIGIRIPEATVTEYLKSPPFIPIANALNLRTITSSTLAPGLIFRSGSLAHIPVATLKLLKERYSITTIVDLRSSEEKEKSPDPEVEGIENVWIPSTIDLASQARRDGGEENKLDASSQHLRLSASDFAENDGVDGYVRMYGHVLKTHQDVYRAVFEKLRDGDGRILFHCTGKHSLSMFPFLSFALLLVTNLVLPAQSWQRPHRRTRSHDSCAHG